MILGVKVLFVFLGIIIAAVVTLKIIKRILRIGKYPSSEYKIEKSTFSDWKCVLENPGEIRLETLNAGKVFGSVYGMINLKNKADLQIKDEKLEAPLLAHLIRHKGFGDFLVDTGFDSAYAERPWGHIEGLLKKGCKFNVEEGKGIKELLEQRQVNPKGVFCTHFHEHQGGAPCLPDDTQFVFGKGEIDFDYIPFMYARFLKDKTNIRSIDFEKADEMPIVGKAVDVFGDGSFWAISTPGHTAGHISYLVNGIEGQYMLMGDICMCKKGYELGIESGGTYAKSLKKNKESFFKIKKFLETYPNVKPIFGHESEEFKVLYK